MGEGYRNNVSQLLNMSEVTKGSSALVFRSTPRFFVPKIFVPHVREA
jgi:hypothetical protein